MKYIVFILLTSILYSKQYICISFDGSKQAYRWKEYYELARKYKDEGYKLNFTFFISGVYFITKSNSHIYNKVEPNKPKSLINYSDKKADIIDRDMWIGKMQQEGHEIGSHDNGHHFGNLWTYNQWASEIKQFRSLVSNWPANNGFNNTPTINFSAIKGHRPPNLEINDDGRRALVENGFTYNLSLATHKIEKWISTNQNGLYEIYHPIIPISIIDGYGNVKAKKLIAMDYNMYVNYDWMDSSTNVILKSIAETMLLTDFISYFLSCYTNQNNPPVQLSFHFSDMNNGMYHRVMYKFIDAVIRKNDVEFVTYQELLEKKLDIKQTTLGFNK